MDNALGYLMAFCGIGGLLFFIIGSYVKYSPARRRMTENYDQLKTKMKEVSLEQLTVLNNMYANCAISENKYLIQKTLIKQNLLEVGMNPSFIDEVPTPKPIDKEALLNDLLSVTTSLNQRGELDLEEFNAYINQALDEKKNIK